MWQSTHVHDWQRMVFVVRTRPMFTCIRSQHHMQSCCRSALGLLHPTAWLGTVEHFSLTAVSACCLYSLRFFSRFLLVVLQLALNSANLLDLFLCSATLNARILIYYLTQREHIRLPDLAGVSERHIILVCEKWVLTGRTQHGSQVALALQVLHVLEHANMGSMQDLRD